MECMVPNKMMVMRSIFMLLFLSVFVWGEEVSGEEEDGPKSVYRHGNFEIKIPENEWDDMEGYYEWVFTHQQAFKLFHPSGFGNDFEEKLVELYNDIEQRIEDFAVAINKTYAEEHDEAERRRLSSIRTAQISNMKRQHQQSTAQVHRKPFLVFVGSWTWIEWVAKKHGSFHREMIKVRGNTVSFVSDKIALTHFELVEHIKGDAMAREGGAAGSRFHQFTKDGVDVYVYKIKYKFFDERKKIKKGTEEHDHPLIIKGPEGFPHKAEHEQWTCTHD